MAIPKKVTLTTNAGAKKSKATEERGPGRPAGAKNKTTKTLAAKGQAKGGGKSATNNLKKTGQNDKSVADFIARGNKTISEVMTKVDSLKNIITKLSNTKLSKASSVVNKATKK